MENEPQYTACRGAAAQHTKNARMDFAQSATEHLRLSKRFTPETSPITQERQQLDAEGAAARVLF